MLKPKKPVKMMPYKAKVDPRKKPSPGMSKSKDKMSIDDIIKHRKKTKNMPRLKKGGMSCSCGGKGCLKCGGAKKYQDGGKKKDKWGRPEGSKWYGFDASKKKFVTGPKTTAALKKTLTSKGAKVALPDPDPDRSISDSVRYDRGNVKSMGIPYKKDYPGVVGFTKSYPGDKAVIKAAQRGRVRVYKDDTEFLKRGGTKKTVIKKAPVKKTVPKKMQDGGKLKKTAKLVFAPSKTPVKKAAVKTVGKKKVSPKK